MIDLSENDCPNKVINLMTEYDCRFFIYNAAYGPVRPFLENTEEELNRYIDLNIRSMIHIVHRSIAMHQDGPLGILLVSSLAGFRGTKYVVPYAATKAFIMNFAEGIYWEFPSSKLTISICIPGATNTPGYRSSNPRKFWLTPKPMQPDKVARFALSNFGKRLYLIPGLSNRISHFVMNRMFPRQIANRMHNWVMSKMYEAED